MSDPTRPEKYSCSTCVYFEVDENNIKDEDGLCFFAPPVVTTDDVSKETLTIRPSVNGELDFCSYHPYFRATDIQSLMTVGALQKEFIQFKKGPKK